MTQYLLIGSVEATSGKSATILGIGSQLQEKGISFTYAKPLGTCYNKEKVELDLDFINSVMSLGAASSLQPLLSLDDETIAKRISGKDSTNYTEAISKYLKADTDLILLEGAGNLSEGRLFDLSIAQIAEKVKAKVLLVARYHSLEVVESLLKAKDELGEKLIGVIINDIPEADLNWLQTQLEAFLENKGISVLGMLPRNKILRSISVRQIAEQLSAKVLCGQEQLDLMVESLTVGAMNVSSAMEYFRQRENMAVVTGGDRTDLQLAALDTSTNCIILTGHVPPQELILNRAKQLGVPILSVNLDTLSTVEIIDSAFGNVRIQEPIKVQCIKYLMAKHFAIDKLLEKPELKPAVTA